MKYPENFCNPFLLNRARLGLSARSFCAKFGFNYSWYLKAESHKIDWKNMTVSNFERLSRAYGVSLIQLWNQCVVYGVDRELYDGDEVFNQLIDEPEGFWYEQG